MIIELILAVSFLVIVILIFITIIRRSEYVEAVSEAHTAGALMRYIGFDYLTTLGIYNDKVSMYPGASEREILNHMVDEFNLNNLFLSENGGSVLIESYNKAKDTELTLLQLIEITYNQISIPFNELEPAKILIILVSALSGIWLLFFISYIIYMSTRSPKEIKDYYEMYAGKPQRPPRPQGYSRSTASTSLSSADSIEV